MAEITATGRRKDSVARVRIRPGQGKILINRREIDVYFKGPIQRQAVLSPLIKTERKDAYDVVVNVRGGGITGQSGAIRHGLARCIEKAEPELRAALKAAGYLTRDPRVVERKKPGRPGARRSFQFSKR